MKISTAIDPEIESAIKTIRAEYPQISNKDLYFYCLTTDKLPLTDDGVWEYLDFLKYLSIYHGH